jgi:phasin family protein
MHHSEEHAMSLSERVIESTVDVREQAAAYAARAAEFARAGADRAATQVAAARGPVDLLTEASLKLNTLYHQYMSRLLARQGAMLKGTLVEGEKRLQRLARATSLQQAVVGQVEDMNQIPARIADNVRETWQIVAEAGREVAQLASYTYGELTQAAPRPRSTATPPPRKARAKGGRKTASRRRAA